MEAHAGHFWIRDRGQRVALFIRMPEGGYFCNAVFLRQPGSPEPEFPESYHSATAIGVQADIRWRWGTGWLPMQQTALELNSDSATVTFVRRSANEPNEQHIRVGLRRNGTGPTDYVLGIQTRLLAKTPPHLAIEFLNFLPADAGNSWPDRKLYHTTVHETAPGSFERRPHSQLTVLEPYYWPDASGFRRPHVEEPPFESVFDPALRRLGSGAPFAVSHLHKPLARGGVLFFAGEKVAPAVRVSQSSAPVVLHTCDVWYDEHFCLTQGVLQPDGRHLYEACYEIFRLPPAEAGRGLAASSAAPESPWTSTNAFAPFFCGRVNTFATPASIEYNGATGLFFAYENPAHLVSWQRSTDLPGMGAIVLNSLQPVEPTSGQHYQSVRYDLAGPRPWIEAFPLGFALHVARGTTVVISGLVRVEGDVEAWLEIREAFWGKFHREQYVGAETQSSRTAGVRAPKWVRVEIRLTARIPGSLSMIYLAMAGLGRAWFAGLQVKPDENSDPIRSYP